MESAMSTRSNKSCIAKLLLDRLSISDRVAVVREAVQSLRQNSNASEVGLAIALLAEQSDSEARDGLLTHLYDSLLIGDFQHAELICSLDQRLCQDALENVIVQLAAMSNFQLESGSTYQAVSMTKIFNSIPTTETTQSNGINGTSIVTLLRFASSADASDLSVRPLMELFRSTLIFMGSVDQKVCTTASTAFVTVFTGPAAITVDDDVVWQCIKALTSHTEDPFFPRLGYSFWLRWAACKDMVICEWFDQSYWNLLRLGLQNGDTERRKQCLGILRRSILDASEDPSLHEFISSSRSDVVAPEAIVGDYEKFLTVFETIVLGRYLNQVVACENDLDNLALPTSLVKSEWLYTLLAASLGSSMQDSNRKWLGAWIMRSKFQPDSSDAMLDFVKSAFLPWAMQGSLFTSSLKMSNDRIRCFHGERLAAYMEHLLRHNVYDVGFTAQLLDIVLNNLVERRRNSFAYAAVYLLDGLGHVLENSHDLVLDEHQMHKVSMLSSWSAVPEVAREYVLFRCSKIYRIALDRFNGDTSVDIRNSTPTVPKWHSLCHSLHALRQSTSGGLGTPIVNLYADKSSRDQQEEEVMAKCHTLRAFIDNDSDLSTTTKLSETLQDIWSDLEYLEYPKRLVAGMPLLTLHSRVVRAAIHSDTLKSTIVQITLQLQALSENRLYIFSPLVSSLRSAVLSSAEAAAILPVQEIITGFAQALPEPTIDFRLEDATTYMLTDIDPELASLGYTYYFGDRESIGFSALLDLVSRLGREHSSLLEAILDDLLWRWRRQKIPTPTVSPWKSTLQLQIMLLCCEVIIPRANTSKMEQIMNDLHYILSIEPLPRYRYLLGWILARSYLVNITLQPQILAELRSTDHHSNPKFLASLMKISVMLARAEGASEDFAIQLAAAFVPLAASSKVVIRHEAQWRVPVLMDHARAMGWKRVTENASFVALDDYIRSFERFDVPPPERLLDRLDPVNDHNLTNLVEGKWWGLDSIEMPLCGHGDFVELYRRDALQEQNDYAMSSMPLGRAIASSPTVASASADDNAKPVEVTAELAPGTGISSSRALQTKGTAYLQDLTLNEDGLARNDIIVIASLVDNPYNLGGLSRVSEIFGARELHLQNQNVVSNKDFIGVAVSSHLHFPICQLSAAVLPTYLAGKKSEGYAVVGIEQTDRSLLLGSPGCQIPKKCILVIGSEKEGIPGLVLGECDVLVEIPQQGITRSLNVQTAAAIVLFEYARQHRIVASI